MKVDVIITSCGRFDLLQDTIDALLKHSKDEINNVFVYDDYGKMSQDMLKDFFGLVHLYDGTPEVKITKGEENIGQVAAIDFLMRHVKTEYYLHLEDDFVAIKGDFLDEAIRFLKQGFGSVSLRGSNPKDHNGQPVLDNVMQRWADWSGWQYAPSVRRLKDYDKPYSLICTWDKNKPWESERQIGDYYEKRGLRFAATTDKYFQHTGGARTTYGHPK